MLHVLVIASFCRLIWAHPTVVPSLVARVAFRLIRALHRPVTCLPALKTDAGAGLVDAACSSVRHGPPTRSLATV
ncbi:hypothetical protein PF005_g25894 [Phytophthora fragariae]|uniref:Secreted protein n=1 Tax=Phytophthora fragariae TaxID=53985 RepID=A0A6A3HYG0_9STRA|nr:hypothetical protein PF009_g21521 [Phytophthora fragariae]KAE8975040.1 hypothetical protein PF011_g24630 [Phytophthora fragariae]KAE9074911.1 hypothetical protein PF010_g24500 [Phytophthora fragariae]KAE9086976.1 hypothetical protein PF007_g20555 [Phytophthora fragariae]KAE9090278.1 hypothetical protein PF006_g25192 [Phytophthora fragariae]